MFPSANDDDDDDCRLELQLGIRGSSCGTTISSSDDECSSTSSSSHFDAIATTHDDYAPVIGWPPVRRTHTMMANRAAKLQSISSSAKSNTVFISSVIDEKDGGVANVDVGSSYVKVNMDGNPIGRKINLASFLSYETLARKLEDMFFNSQPSSSSFLFIGSDRDKNVMTDTRQTGSKLLMGSSEFVLTFEDNDGDWMLVGDVPWRMFRDTVKRLRIMRTSTATSIPVIM